MAAGIEPWMSEVKALAKRRAGLIDRAKTQEGIRITGQGGFGNAGKVVIDLDTFETILNRLSHQQQ